MEGFGIRYRGGAQYNYEHRHSGLGLMTPFDVHHGLADLKQDLRREVLQAAFLAHPERFKGRMPSPPKLPKEAWINKPCQTVDVVQ